MWILHKFQVDFLKKSQFTVISPTICFIWKATFHAVLCVCTWIMHVTLCAVGLQWHKMNRKCPEHPSSSLLTTAAEEKQTSHRLLFLFFLVFSPHDMNVFVTDFIVHNVVTHVQGFSSGILIIFFEKLWNVKESWLTCGSRARLMCSSLCGNLD